MPLRARVVALLIASVAWAGLAIQFSATRELGYSLSATTGILLAYFTITTNLLVAILFTAIAAGARRVWLPSVLAGLTLSILMVGVIYFLLLRGLHELSGGSFLANALLHQVTPIAVPLFWLVFARKGLLTPRDPLHWAAYPLVYFLYALTRGTLTGSFAYPFLDIIHLGWPRMLINATLIAVAFLVTAWAFTWLDNALGRLTLPTPA